MLLIRIAVSLVLAFMAMAWVTQDEITGFETVVAKNYPSGFVSEVQADIERMIRMRQALVIQGTIYSAGTIVTKHPAVCAVEDACLAFHAPLHPVTWRPWLGSPRENASYLSQHPPELRDWIVRSGSQTDLSWRYYYLCTPELWQYVRPCLVPYTSPLHGPPIPVPYTGPLHGSPFRDVF